MPRPTLALIAAVTQNGVIGQGGGMPWHIPLDLAHFKRTTLGCPVIMGRKTWDSLGKALPKRRNIVVTRKAMSDFPGAESVPSINEALLLCSKEPLVFCIGGAELYCAALPLADYMYITRIYAHIAGDTFFPEFSLSDWRVESTERHRQEVEPRQFEFVQYVRN